jgi:hypothetical protein
MRYSQDKDIAKSVAELLREGWTFTRGRRHPRVVAPNGRFVSFSVTPSCSNAAARFHRDVQTIKASL